jgi:hypothetical protein
LLGSQYVAGVSDVAIKGQVTSVDYRLASAGVGAASIDYSAQLSVDPELAPILGDSIEALGTQPLAHGKVIVGVQSDDALIVQTPIDVSALSQDRATASEAAGGAKL